MDFDFPPDTLMLRDMLQRFVQKEARPLEMKYFNTGTLSPEERAHLRQVIEQLGLWGLMVPEEYGGGGLDMLTTCMIEIELGKTFIPLEMGDVPPLLFDCVGEQVTRFLEPALVGDRRTIIAAREPNLLRPEEWKTSAASNGDGFILYGCKALSMLPDPVDFYILFAKAPAGLTAFLLDANHPGLSVDTNNEIVLTIQNCNCERDSLLGESGRAMALAAGDAPYTWIRIGARYVGIVDRLIEMAVEYAKDWVLYGAPLATRPAIQRALAEMRVEVESARWLVYHAAWLADMNQDDSIRSPAAQIRLTTGEMLKRTVDRVTMIYAGPGPSTQIEPQRLVQNLVPYEVLELALEHARAVITTEMLNLSDVDALKVKKL